MAADMLLGSPVREAYDLEKEDHRIRDMYGNHIGGQSLLLARRLGEAGVPVVLAVCSAVDVAGAGGTSWSEVEAERQTDKLIRKVAHSFAGWGIPTAYSLIDARREAGSIPVFASGGLRTGIDIAKAIRFGASLCGVAAPALGPADSDKETAMNHLKS